MCFVDNVVDNVVVYIVQICWYKVLTLLFIYILFSYFLSITPMPAFLS